MYQELINRAEPFRNELARFVYYRTYSRWLDSEGRRERWHETVERYCRYIFELGGDTLTHDEKREIMLAIYDHEALGSNRLLWSAGEAARLNGMVAYNCSALDIDCLEAFAEVMFVLMSGTGVGASVEYECVEKLPRVLKRRKNESVEVHVVEDSREGWAQALLFGLRTWFAGREVTFDYSLLRAAGARLMTMGGRSSGPAPLRRLLDFTRDRVQSREGRRLQTIDVADIVNMIGEVVVAGGVRRSAEILLFSPDDPLMLSAKRGAFWSSHPYRAMANNSIAYESKPSSVEFMKSWMELAEGGSGEPGLFNREAWHSTSPRRKKFDRTLTNPCGEISLRSSQTCNLSTVVARPTDTIDDLKKKIRVAARIGTLQSLISNFPFLRDVWKQNQEEERLLGVSITGIADCPILRSSDVLKELRDYAIEINRELAERLEINPSVAVTTVKPEGTTSQYVDTSSGLHVRWSNYYIRRVRIASSDPLLQMMKTLGVPVEPEVGQEPHLATTWVIGFPVKAPEGALTRHDVKALDQLNYWLNIKKHYTEHNPSCTIYVKDDEWLSVGAWCYENWDLIQGLSFLPSSNHVYPMAPYEEITEEQYNALLAEFPVSIDYDNLRYFESDDNTEGAKSYACVGGACEIP